MCVGGGGGGGKGGGSGDRSHCLMDNVIPYEMLCLGSV